MFTLKSVKIIILFTFCSLLLTSCFPSGGQALSTEDNDVISRQIENIVSDNGNLQVDVQLNETVEALPKINVKAMEWDENKLKELFLTERNHIEHEERTTYFDEFFPNDKRNSFFDGDDYWLIYEPGTLISEERHSDAFGYKTMMMNFNLYRFKDYFTDESLSVLSKNEAVSRCTLIMDEVGITNYLEPEVYAITVDKANKFWKNDKYDEYDEYKDWGSLDDEIYIIRFLIEYNNIPVTDISPSIVEGEQVGLFAGTYINFIVTQDKIYSLSANHIFSPEYENEEKISIKCSAENALKIAAEYYNGISLGDDKNVKITDCKLVYAPREWHSDNEKPFTLVPVWEIDAAIYSSNKLMGINENMFIDVQTGNIIIW